MKFEQAVQVYQEYHGMNSGKKYNQVLRRYHGQIR
jgi:hypothetical protein